MGKTQSYVKGGGSHTSVPVPLNSKVELYRTSRKIGSGASEARVSTRVFDARNHRRIEWDISPISEEHYDTVRYEIKKLPTRSKIDMSIIWSLFLYYFSVNFHSFVFVIFPQLISCLRTTFVQRLYLRLWLFDFKTPDQPVLVSLIKTGCYAFLVLSGSYFFTALFFLGFEDIF